MSGICAQSPVGYNLLQSSGGTSLAEAFPSYYGQMPRRSQKIEYSTPEYLATVQMNPAIKQSLIRTAQATGCIVQNGKVNGTALLISPNLVLVPQHCFENSTGQVTFRGQNSLITAKTLLDGTTDTSPGFRGDFKILFIPTIGIPPASLSTSSSIGPSLQIYFQGKNQYIKPYESTRSEYATNCDYSIQSTRSGESGGVRFSTTLQAVHSMHQGERCALKINDIYFALKDMAKNNLNSEKRQVARKILNQINIQDRTTALINFSPIMLRPNSVIPEKPVIQGNYLGVKYMEIRYGNVGGGNRGILIGGREYKLYPNPHGLKAYNKKQETFYADLAVAIVEYQKKHKKLPDYGSKATIFKTQFTLNNPN